MLKWLQPNRRNAPTGLILASAFGLQFAAQLAYNGPEHKNQSPSAKVSQKIPAEENSSRRSSKEGHNFQKTPSSVNLLDPRMSIRSRKLSNKSEILIIEENIPDSPSIGDNKDEKESGKESGNMIGLQKPLSIPLDELQREPVTISNSNRSQISSPLQAEVSEVIKYHYF